MKIDIIGLIRKYGPTVLKGVQSFLGQKKKGSKGGSSIIDDLLGGGQENQTKGNSDGGFGIDDIIKTFVPDENKVAKTSKTTKSKTKKKKR